MLEVKSTKLSKEAEVVKFGYWMRGGEDSGILFDSQLSGLMN